MKPRIAEASWTYVLPIRAWASPDPELTTYLRGVAQLGPVVVVDGSEPHVFDEAHRCWSEFVTHVRPADRFACANGKVQGVMTGMALVHTEAVVIADDDVRYDAEALQACVAQLDDADLVRPQNYFDPLPWHARWDTARTLINRALGADFPGTLAMRTEMWDRIGGYDGNVLFENLELMRTVEAAGGRVVSRPDLYVRRVPPTERHFVSQRVRQAYDDFARPSRLIVSLAVAPAAVALAHHRRFVALITCVVALPIAVAEIGRRRAMGRRRFPRSVALFAPLWVGERAVCSWLAVARRLQGGIGYGGRRIVRAGNSRKRLRMRAEERERAARPNVVADDADASPNTG